MRKIIALTFLMLWGCQEPENARRDRSLALAPYQLSAPGHIARTAAECGTFTVYENRGEGTGRTIDLRVAVVPAIDRAPKPDPLVFLTGGPGQAATESYVGVQSAFRLIHRERDIVLVDQRGTGASNPLRCPKPDDASALWLLEDEAMETWVAHCLEELDADPRFYTTAIAMEDLDDVSEALGYERVNLYGISYGTRAAISYTRQFPDRVRSVILDGIAPPTEVLGVDVARDAQRAFDLLVKRCAEDNGCAKAFPNPEGDLEVLMSELSTSKPVELRHPRTGAEETFTLYRSMAAFAIRLLSYGQETSSLVPLLLHAAAEGDYRPLASQFLMTSGQLEETIADAMGFSVICSEDFPFFDDAEIERQNDGTYIGTVQVDSLRELCPLCPRGDIPADFKDTLRTDIPVLLLSGEADPVTPPSNGELVLSTLENALHLIAPGQGHMVVHRGCISGLAAEFVEVGRHDALETACVEDIQPMSFFTSFAGPEP